MSKERFNAQVSSNSTSLTRRRGGVTGKGQGLRGKLTWAWGTSYISISGSCQRTTVNVPFMFTVDHSRTANRQLDVNISLGFVLWVLRGDV